MAPSDIYSDVAIQVKFSDSGSMSANPPAPNWHKCVVNADGLLINYESG
jgi:hypothetical protein